MLLQQLCDPPLSLNLVVVIAFSNWPFELFESFHSGIIMPIYSRGFALPSFDALKKACSSNEYHINVTQSSCKGVIRLDRHTGWKKGKDNQITMISQLSQKPTPISN